MNLRKKIYFLSDFHLGAPNAEKSLVREKKIINFLDSIKDEAAELFIVGDIFDFWFEYRNVVPKGFVRLLGKLAELTDSGITIRVFVGNHDMWMKDYFQKELNIPVYYKPETFERCGKKFFIGHGDGLGPGDIGYKWLKQIFRNPICQQLFGIFPPYFGIGLANFLSRRSRANTEVSEEIFKGKDGEWLLIYCNQKLQKEKFDFFIFGHRHLPIDFKLNNSESRYINLGDWIRYFTYAEFDGENLELKSFTSQNEKIIKG